MMDARIGQLMRDGKTIYYAFANGYDAPVVEGSLEVIEAALGLLVAAQPRAPTAAVARVTLPAQRHFIVNVRKKYPAWDEHGGFDHDVPAARSKSDAIQQARSFVERSCLFTRSMGPIYYKARQADD